MIDSAKNTFNNLWMGVSTTIYAPPTKSTFFENGKITVDEYI